MLKYCGKIKVWEFQIYYSDNMVWKDHFYGKIFQYLLMRKCNIFHSDISGLNKGFDVVRPNV